MCLGSMEILERAMVVAAMADLMYPLLVAASSNAAASDFSKHFCRGHHCTDVFSRRGTAEANAAGTGWRERIHLAVIAGRHVKVQAGPAAGVMQHIRDGALVRCARHDWCYTCSITQVM